jgi:hypothetical protein
VSGLAISNLALPYPDFKYAEIINADEFDANNAAIKAKVDEIIAGTYTKTESGTTFITKKNPDISWAGLAGFNGWRNYTGGGTFAPLQYRKNELALVSLRGLVEAGGADTKITTLPVGARPAYTMSFSVITSGGNARVNVATNGDVTLVGSFTSFLFLDGIHFYGEL